MFSHAEDIGGIQTEETPKINTFQTMRKEVSAASLVVDVQEPEKPTATPAQTTNLTEFGDEGEQIVY